MRLRWNTILGLAWVLVFCSCSHWPSRTSQIRCHPLGRGPGEDCLLPFPSDFYTHVDKSTPTGIRIDLRDAALPQSIWGIPIQPELFNQRDGFSPVATLLAQFPSSIDDREFLSPDHSQDALNSDSQIQLLRADNLERVPLFAELDANADSKDGEKQALIIQPVIRLKPKTRYIAIIQNLMTTDGKRVPPLSGFEQIRDHRVVPQSFLASWIEHYEEIFKKLKKAGIKRENLQLAWDFTTGSDDAIVGRLVKMRDEAFNKISSMSKRIEKKIEILKIEDHPKDAPNLFRRIKAYFNAPSFLEGGNGDRLKLDPTGRPTFESTVKFPLSIHIPECVKEQSEPVPVLIYGHGTFNSAENEMNTEFSRKILNRLCMIEIGTDWLGRAQSDLAYYLTRMMPNWNNFSQITDRLQQAHINVAVLARLAHQGELDRLPGLLQEDGESWVDSRHVYYFGISEGGCQGVTALALSPDIEKGALNVPCGFWTMFFSRSSDFHKTRWLFRLFYPGAIERQKLLVLTQLLWDYTDPANFGGHLLKDPLPGNRTKPILYQEGINDASVPNITTRAMVRTIGLKLIPPYTERVEGVEIGVGPLSSGYSQFDIGIRPRVGGNNVPPAPTTVHEEIRKLEAAQLQLWKFFKGGGQLNY